MTRGVPDEEDVRNFLAAYAELPHPHDAHYVIVTDSPEGEGPEAPRALSVIGCCNDLIHSLMMLGAAFQALSGTEQAMPDSPNVVVDREDLARVLGIGFDAMNEAERKSYYELLKIIGVAR